VGLGEVTWVLLGVAALIFGVCKTSIGNLGLIGVILLAQVLPAKDSTGVALLLLLVGDAVAVIVFRKSVEWKLLVKLIPAVAVGLVLGSVFLHFASDTVLKKTIGVIILILLLIGLKPDKIAVQHPAVAFGYGSMAGFTTMVANAGGPAMSLYLLASKFDKFRFLGTSAYYFALVNLAKVPFSIGLGIIRPELALVALPLVPVVLLGTWLGKLIVNRLNQRTFDRLVMVFVAFAAVYLIVA
jgi:uncharacterized membrane protein YfcA